jgi:taurine dioxygenase
MTRLTLTPLHPLIGAEVAGLNLHKPVDAETNAELSAALSEHLALVIRDQQFTPDEYLAAAGVFGPVMRQHYSQYNMPDHPDIGVIRHRDGQEPASMWHTDHTNRERPPKATMLFGLKVARGGDTSIASMRAAYAALPEAECQHLATLRTRNGIDNHRTDVRPEDREKYDIPVYHPMVRTHPEHGSNAVYFHITKAHCIDGMTPEDSKAYMNELLARMIQPEITYRHEWRKGDLLIFDNRATMHSAHGDYDRSQDRVLWRIIVEGDRPRLDLAAA